MSQTWLRDPTAETSAIKRPRVEPPASLEGLTIALFEATTRPGSEIVAGLDGIGEGVPHERAAERVPKFHDDGLMIVRAGGQAGLFSAILPGWLAGRNKLELQPVTKEVSKG